MQTATQPEATEAIPEAQDITKKSGKKTKTAKMEDVEAAGPQGFVFYTDGGCMPHTGMMGWGFHGYRYEVSKPKRGSGHASHTVTRQGYFPKSEKKEEVTPLDYFDAFGCSQNRGTNNQAEVLAAKNAFSKVLEYEGIKEITIKTDSEYLLKGVTEYSTHWIRNNWIRRDGQPVPNRDVWKSLLADVKVMDEKGIKLNIKWVRGHNDNFGNTLADKLATVGVVNSIQGNDFNEIKKSATEGYWKREVTRHPFFYNKAYFFNTLTSSHVKGEYFMGNFPKEDELFGTRDADGAYALVQMAEPQPVMEMIREYQTEMSGDFDCIVMARTEKLFHHQTNEELMDYGRSALVRTTVSRLDLKALDKQPLTRGLEPALLSWRAIDNISLLKAMLTNFRMGVQRDDMCLTDITSEFYDVESTEKKGVTSTAMKLKASFIVGIQKHKTKAKGLTQHGTIEIPFTLVFGQDMPDRNALKRLEAHNPKVQVLTWSDAPDVFRYATLIESEGNFVLCASMISNTFYYEP